MHAFGRRAIDTLFFSGTHDSCTFGTHRSASSSIRPLRSSGRRPSVHPSRLRCASLTQLAAAQLPGSRVYTTLAAC